MRATWKLTAEQRDAVPALYASGLSSCEIGHRFGVHANSVLGLMRRRGEARRSMSQATSRYRCNANFFRSITTEASAYWFGFLAADGCVSVRRTGSTLILQLAARDRGHIERLREDLESEHPISTVMTHGKVHARISIGSRLLCEGLIANGMIPRKSTRLAFPAFDTSVLHHYMRGYFDGDGTISATDRPSRAYFSVAGYEPFIREYQRQLAHSCGLTLTAFRRNKNNAAVQVVYTGRLQLIRIREFLYRDAMTFLPRKRERFDILQA